MTENIKEATKHDLADELKERAWSELPLAFAISRDQERVKETLSWRAADEIERSRHAEYEGLVEIGNLKREIERLSDESENLRSQLCGHGFGVKCEVCL